MNYMQKAALSQKKKKGNIVKISVVAAICVVGIVLLAYSVSVKRYIYALLYLLAVILGLSYVVIKINTVVPAYIAASRDTLYIQCWDNGVFSYKVNFKPSFLSDFIPAKTVRYEIPIKDIKSVLVGSRNYLVRNLEGTSFDKTISILEKNGSTERNAIKKMDFICVVDNKNKVRFMPVGDMEADSLAKVVNLIHRKNEEAEIKCNLRDIRNRLTIQ